MRLVSVYCDRCAVDFLYEICLLREREHESSISFKCPPRSDHHAFVASRPYRCWYIIDDDGWCGYISATILNEIGIVLMPTVRRLGVGAAAVRLFMAKHEPLPSVPGMRNGRWLANINPSNQPSIALFTKLGFNLIQHTYAL